MRKLKLLGLGLMAMLALSAIASAGAQATETVLEAEAEGETTITGTEVSKESHPRHQITIGNNVLSCGGELFEGTLAPGPNASVSVTPTYSNCHTIAFGFITFPVTVTHNECELTFYGGKEATENHFESITTDIVCSESKAIEVHIYENKTNHEAEVSACTWTIGSQIELHTNDATNTQEPTPDDLDVTHEVSGLAIHVHPGTLGENCGPTEMATTYTGATTVRAYADEAHTEQVGLTATTVE